MRFVFLTARRKVAIARRLGFLILQSIPCCSQRRFGLSAKWIAVAKSEVSYVNNLPSTSLFSRDNWLNSQLREDLLSGKARVLANRLMVKSFSSQDAEESN